MERVADYPRPPRAELDARRVRIVHGGVTVADTTRAIRVCETASPPTFYVPLADITPGLLERTAGSTFCEWKGAASYWSLRVGDDVVRDAAWGYERPDSRYLLLADHVAFYASRVDQCWVGDEQATPQPGRFYGGWVTSEIEGPFKGEPGTEHW